MDLPKTIEISPRWRDPCDIHKAIITGNSPALGKIRNSNTGAPADAGRLAELVLDKFNSLFKRLNLNGYRHYHNFDGWMKSVLLDTVQAELLSARSLDRGVLNREGVQRLIEHTRSGIRDYGYLLQVLLNVEIWQQEFCD